MWSDFIVNYDPERDTHDDLFKKILKSLVINRIRIKKPVIIFMGGDSGEAKSSNVVKMEMALLELMNMDIRNYMTEEDDVMNVYTPIQYPHKLNKILYDPKYKKINIICLHEARDLVKAKLWHNFVSMAIADINAQVRQIKPMVIFITSQFIRDITTDIRYTLTYYITTYRLQQKEPIATIRIFKMYKDDRDLENPKLKKRNLKGVLVYPDGTRRVFNPNKFYFKPPPPDLQKIMDKNDLEAKKDIIKNKIEKLINEMNTELGLRNPKIPAMVQYYLKNPEGINKMGKTSRGKFKLNTDFLKAHDLTVKEGEEFKRLFDKKIKGDDNETTSE